MIRKIVEIDQAKCIGCGLCAEACHEDAIQMIDGKAQLIKDDYCDGLGDCLPACPADAITIIEREAAAYDEEAVKARQAAKVAGAGVHQHVDGCHGEGTPGHPHPAGFQCPGSMVRTFERQEAPVAAPQGAVGAAPMSQISTWPVQIQLLPVKAPFYDGKKLLIAADCTAFAYGDFHNRFIKNHVVAIGCPKLDPVDYTEKLTAILAQNDIASVEIVRMEVPCCTGIVNYTKQALQACGKMIPWQISVISCDGRLLEN